MNTEQPDNGLPKGVYLRSDSAGRPYLHMTASDEFDYRMGSVRTAAGIVAIYDQGRRTSKPYTRLDFVHEGRVHSASWERVFQDRFLVTLAQRFVDLVRGAGA